MRTAPPDFIGVGTQRSGTTWWFEAILSHPRVRRPQSRRKELHFFDRFCVRPMEQTHVDAYYELFPRKPGELCGEWTPRYMHDFWTPLLIARAAPDAKLLAMFRDPVERFRSGVPHRLSRMPDSKIETACADAIERGRYATQLKRLLAYHDASKLLVIQYEKCIADPAGQYRRTLEFLGLDPDFRYDGFDRPRGTTQAQKKKPLGDDLTDGLRAAFEPEVVELAALAPEIDVSLWKNFAHLTVHA